MINLFKEAVLSIAYKAVEIGFNIIEKLDEQCYVEPVIDNSFSTPHNQMVIFENEDEFWGDNLREELL